MRGKLEEDRAKYEYQEKKGEEGEKGLDRQSTWWFKRELIIQVGRKKQEEGR